MEGTVTISTERYNELMAYARAVNKRQSIYVRFNGDILYRVWAAPAQKALIDLSKAVSDKDLEIQELKKKINEAEGSITFWMSRANQSQEVKPRKRWWMI